MHDKSAKRLGDISTFRINAAYLDAHPHEAGLRGLLELTFDGAYNLILGRACNLDCVYCYVGDYLPPLESWAKLKAVVDRAAELGLRKTMYFNAEPTVHPRFLDIARHVRRAGSKVVTLLTNGVKLADPAFVDATAKAGVDAVVFSVDLFEKEPQERLHGRGFHKYDEVQRGLLNLLERTELPVVVVSVVNEVTIDSLSRNIEVLAGLRDRHKRTIASIMSLMHEPWGGKRDLIRPVDLVKSAAKVRKALLHARRLGLPALTTGYPPCLLDGCAASAFEMYVSEQTLDLDTGKRRDTDFDRARSACPTCPAGDAFSFCRGVDESYASEPTMAKVRRRAARMAE